jgi:hypothetical protein
MTLAIYSDEGLQLAAENLEVFTFTIFFILNKMFLTRSATNLRKVIMYSTDRLNSIYIYI